MSGGSARTRLPAFIIQRQLIALALTACVSLASAAGWFADTYPNPQMGSSEEAKRCRGRDFEANSSWICDPDHLISAEGANQIDYAMKLSRDKLECACSNNCSRGAYPIGVALVEWVNFGQTYIPHRNRVKNFTDHLRKKWFTVDRHCDDSVMIAYAYVEDQMYISTGETANTVILDTELTAIYEQFRANLDKNNQTTIELSLGLTVVGINRAINTDSGLSYSAYFGITVSSSTFLLVVLMCVAANCKKESKKSSIGGLGAADSDDLKIHSANNDNEIQPSDTD